MMALIRLGKVLMVEKAVKDRLNDREIEELIQLLQCHLSKQAQDRLNRGGDPDHHP